MLRRLLAPALLLALALATLAACGSDERAQQQAATRTTALSSRELGWIRGYSALAFAFYDGEITGHVLSWKRLCAERLAKAGRPPTARLRPAYAKMRDA